MQVQKTRWTRVSVSGLLLVALVVFAVEAGAQQVGNPFGASAAGRRVHVTSLPQGVRVSAGGGLGGLLFASAVTPHTLTLPADGYGTIVLGGPGFERAQVAIPPGTQDLYLEVRMSRPVFEAGIALVSIFGLAAVGGAITMALNADAVSSEGISDDGFYGGLWTVVGASPGLIAGILMAILDRQRRPTWRWLEQPGT